MLTGDFFGADVFTVRSGGHAYASIAIQPAFRLGDHASRIKPAVTIPRHLMLAVDM
jgi:hypothetical protein